MIQARAVCCRLLLLGCLVSWGLPRAANAVEDYAAIEAAIAEEQAKNAKAWLTLALDLAGRDLKAEAHDAWARAKAAKDDLTGLPEAETKIAALPGAGHADDASAKRILRTREEVAKAHERMSKVLEKEQQDARFSAFLVTALRLSPTKARVATLAAMAQKAPLLVQAEGHPFSGWLSLPKSWKPGKVHPLLLVFEGEGQQFAGALGRFAAERKDQPWILLAPLAFAGGDELKFDRYFPAYTQQLISDWNGRRGDFDAAGLPGLIAFVRAQFGGAPQSSLAALGKGAEPALAYLTRHPAAVSAVSLALARFDASALATPESLEGGGAPIDLLGKGTAVGNDATEDHATLLGARGFTQVAKREPQGTGPSELAAQQWAWLAAPGAR